ncbi:hypothetical protein Tco_1371906 [Tanacetum coccineum]
MICIRGNQAYSNGNLAKWLKRRIVTQEVPLTLLQMHRSITKINIKHTVVPCKCRSSYLRGSRHVYDDCYCLGHNKKDEQMMKIDLAAIYATTLMETHCVEVAEAMVTIYGSDLLILLAYAPSMPSLLSLPLSMACDDSDGCVAMVIGS